MYQIITLSTLNLQMMYVNNLNKSGNKCKKKNKAKSLGDLSLGSEVCNQFTFFSIPFTIFICLFYIPYPGFLVVLWRRNIFPQAELCPFVL